MIEGTISAGTKQLAAAEHGAVVTLAFHAVVAEQQAQCCRLQTAGMIPDGDLPHQVQCITYPQCVQQVHGSDMLAAAALRPVAAVAAVEISLGTPAG